MTAPVEYLGDGVYASFDGWHIWLRTDSDGSGHTIALKPRVFAALVRYRDQVYANAKDAGPPEA